MKNKFREIIPVTPEYENRWNLFCQTTFSLLQHLSPRIKSMQLAPNVLSDSDKRTVVLYTEALSAFDRVAPIKEKTNEKGRRIDTSMAENRSGKQAKVTKTGANGALEKGGPVRKKQASGGAARRKRSQGD